MTDDEDTPTNAPATDHERASGSDDARSDASSDDRDRTDSRGDDREGVDRDRADRGRRGRSRTGFFEGDLYERLQWLALVVLVLVAVATLFSFYTNVTRLISIWASRKYEPALQAAFALAVLASALAGIVSLSRNLR